MRTQVGSHHLQPYSPRALHAGEGLLPTSVCRSDPQGRMPDATMEQAPVMVRSIAASCLGRLIFAGPFVSSSTKGRYICSLLAKSCEKTSCGSLIETLGRLPPSSPATSDYRPMIKGAATEAMLPSVSNQLEGPTFAPAGTVTHWLDFRSTAGSCFGRFICLLRSW